VAAAISNDISRSPRGGGRRAPRLNDHYCHRHRQLSQHARRTSHGHVAPKASTGLFLPQHCPRPTTGALSAALHFRRTSPRRMFPVHTAGRLRPLHRLPSRCPMNAHPPTTPPPPSRLQPAPPDEPIRPRWPDVAAAGRGPLNTLWPLPRAKARRRRGLRSAFSLHLVAETWVVLVGVSTPPL
jgi:hypothetical protein